MARISRDTAGYLLTIVDILPPFERVDGASTDEHD
jgi:hypothetical protein